MRNDCLARRTSTDATAPATGAIISDQRLENIEPAALLNKDTATAPVAATFAATLTIYARHSLVIRDINLAIGGSFNFRLHTRAVAASDTQTAALAVKRFVARNRATCHGKLNLFVPETGINTAACFFGVVSCNGAALHG